MAAGGLTLQRIFDSFLASKRTVLATAEIRNAAQFDIEKNCEESVVLSAQRLFWSSEKMDVSSTFGIWLLFEMLPTCA